MSRTVIHEALRAVQAGTPAALATVVATKGSTPQKVGAKLLVRPDGGVAGTLGGGAVEAEAIREAREVLARGAPVRREYPLSTGTDEWGLACGGTMVVFIDPLTADARPWIEAAAAALGAGEPVAVTTLIGGPGGLGAKLLVRAGGAEGSLGEPTLDQEAVELGTRLLEREEAEVASVGEALLYGECFARATLIVAGAGHVGKALAGLGRFLGFRVVVIDDRPEYASRERFPEADEVIARPMAEALATYPMHARSAIVVAARNHDLDYEVTRAALAAPARYVGLLGSRRKAVLITERLVAEGVPPERIRQLRSPIGLDLGARTPEEIALSILGEILMLRQAAAGRPMQLSDELRAKAVARAGAEEKAAGRQPDA